MRQPLLLFYEGEKDFGLKVAKKNVEIVVMGKGGAFLVSILLVSNAIAEGCGGAVAALPVMQEQASVVSSTASSPSLFDLYGDEHDDVAAVRSLIKGSFPELLAEIDGGGSGGVAPVADAQGGNLSPDFVTQLIKSMKHLDEMEAKNQVEKNHRDAMTAPNYDLLPENQKATIMNWIRRVSYLDQEMGTKLERSLALMPINSPHWALLCKSLDEHASPLLDIALVALIRKNDYKSVARRLIRNALKNPDIRPFNRRASPSENKFINNVQKTSEADKKLLLEWLRLLEIYNTESYKKVLEEASQLPENHPKWTRILDRVKMALTPPRNDMQILDPVANFTMEYHEGGDVKNFAHFQRSATEEEKKTFAALFKRNELRAQEKLRLGKDPENWNHIPSEWAFMFLRRVEDMNPDYYTRLLKVFSSWEATDPKWQLLYDRLSTTEARKSPAQQDFDLAHDLLE